MPNCSRAIINDIISVILVFTYVSQALVNTHEKRQVETSTVSGLSSRESDGSMSE